MLVSIITPCRNSGRTIRQTIESVLQQTYKDIEYIIVDGGSKDGTLEIINEYCPKFNGRMKFVSEKDKGIYDAMNKGLRMSRGRLIGIINSDDWYEPDAVEKILNHMTGDRYQVVYGYCNWIGNNRVTGIMKSDHKRLAHGMIPHQTCFVTRSAYRDFGMFLAAFKIAGDYELMARFYKTNEVTFTQIKEVLANYRLGGISSNARRAMCENALIAYYHKMITFRELVKRLSAYI